MNAPKYAVGDTVYWRDHNDEPMIYGLVVEVYPCDTHPAYYYVDYETPSGYGMRAGMPENSIQGRVPRVEKEINPVLELTDDTGENYGDGPWADGWQERCGK